MNEPIRIAVIEGSTRPDRRSIHIAHFVAEVGKKIDGIEIIFVDPRNLTLPDDGDDVHDPRYTEITAKADAFFIVMPEYNHSFPGSLKRLLDSEYDNYKHKAVAIAGVSSGLWGGARGVESLKPTLVRLGLSPIWNAIYFPHINDILDESDAIKPEFLTTHTNHVNASYKELIWMAKALKWGRENLK